MPRDAAKTRQMNLAVADTSVLVAFSAIHLLDALRAIFAKVLIPEAVCRELIDQGSGWIEASDVQAAIRAGEWIAIEAVTAMQELSKTRWDLFSGEAEAIPLAERHQCPILLDDPEARKVASHRGLLVIGTLGLLILGKRRGIIPGYQSFDS